MPRPARCPPRASLALAALVLAGAARLPGAEPALTVVYDGRSTALSQADLSAMAHRETTAYDAHEKQSHAYAGVPVRELLARAGVDFGEKLRGRGLRLAVLARCRNHYDVAFALAEFDDAFNARTILLADREDGRPLPDGQGPLRLVVPGDKRVARWARMVTSLEVVDLGAGAAP